MRKKLSALIIMLSIFQSFAAMAYDFTPGVSLSLSGEYNDNIFLSHTDKKSDFISRISPSFYCTLKSANSALTGSYSPSFSLYKSHEDLNTTSHAASLQGLYTPSERTTLSLTDTFVLSKEISNLSQVSELGPVRTRTEHTVNTLNGAFAYKVLGNLTYSLGAGYIDTDVEGAGNQNSKTYSGTMGATYAISERSSLSANAKYTKYDYSPNSDANSQDYTLGATYKLFPMLTIGLTGGAVSTEIEDTGRRSTDFSGGIEISNRSERGSAVLSYRRGVVPGIEERGPLTSEVVSLGLSRSLTTLWTTSFLASYSTFKSASASATDTDEWRFGANLAYAVSQRASVGLSYNFVRLNDKIDSARGYYNHIAFLTLRLDYSKGAGK